MKTDAATRDARDHRAAGARAVVQDAIRRRDRGESLSDATIEAEHAALMPELAEELERARRVEEAHRRARRDASAPTQEWPGPGEPRTPMSLMPSSKSDDERLAHIAIPGYKILRSIGQGGMGAVYEAIQLKHGKKVAIKVLLGGPLAGPRDHRRFELEVQVLAKLCHPNIVGVHDSGKANGYPFFVMDYVHGQPLDAYMKDRALSIDSKLELFRTICDAVNEAHLKGVTHRDLKPGNILVSDDGTPQVLDFGLAKVATEHVMDRSGAYLGTLSDRFMGTLPWASPEQAEGKPDKVDTRSDIYSLGVILFQMLTNKFPYDVVGNLHAVIENILTVEPVRPRSIDRQIARDLELIILKCLEKPRDRRYQVAGLLREDIDRYRNNLPVTPQPPSILYLIRKAAERNKFAAAVVGLVGVILVSSVAASAGFVYVAQKEREDFDSLRQAFNTEAQAAASGLAEFGRWYAFRLFLGFWRAGIDHEARDAGSNEAIHNTPLLRAAVDFLLDPRPLIDKTQDLREAFDRIGPEGGSDGARRALEALVVAEQHVRDGERNAAIRRLGDAVVTHRTTSSPRESWITELVIRRLNDLEPGEAK